MALIKTRPEIQLLAPTYVRVGERFEVRVVLDCPEALPCKGIQLRHHGELRRGENGAGRRMYQAVANIPVDGGELPAGRHERRVALTVPRGAPPQYRGNLIKCAHLVAIRVDIPWWPDARGAFELGVIEAAADEPNRAAWSGGVFGSSADAGADGRPYIELSLASRLLVPGETCVAALSLFNTDRHRYRGITVRLSAIERVSGYTQTRPVISWRVPVEDPREGASMPLRLRVPPNLVSAFRLDARSGIDWSLEVSADLAWGDPRVRIAVNVSRSHEPQAAIAEVGNVRLARVWSTVADELGLESDASGMTGEHRGVRFRIARDGAIGVDVSITTGGLGLGLSMGGWRDRIGVREEGHLDAARTHAEPAAEAIGVFELDDDRARARHDRAGRNPEPLRSYARAVLAFAAALAELPDVLSQVGPPRALAEQLEAWRAMAEDEGGTLTVASMQIDGTRRGTRWRIAPNWDGAKLAGVRVSVRPEPGMEGRHHLSWRAEDDAAPHTALRLPEDVWQGALGLTIDGEWIAVVTALAEDLAEDVHARLGALVEFCRHRRSGGAYR